MALLAASLLPLGVYALLLRLLDRYRRIPWRVLALALVWGALPAFGIAYLAEGLPVAFAAGERSAVVYTVLFVPVCEETAKGVGLLVLALMWGQHLDSPLAGILCGAWVGLGFTAMENALYVLDAARTQSLLVMLRLLFSRAGVFGLNHAFYTALVGLGCALAGEARHKGWAGFWLIGGWLAAMLAHGLHNALAVWGQRAGQGLPMVGALVGVWVLGCALLALVGWAFVMEGVWVGRYARRLSELGELPSAEVPILTYGFLRGVVRWEALLRGEVAHWRALGRYYVSFTRAALAWQRAERTRRARDQVLRDTLQAEFLRLRRLLGATGQSVVR